MRRMLVFMGFLLASGHAMAGQRPARSGSGLQIGSEILGPMILGQKVRIMMRDASYLECRVLRASRDEILVRISKAEMRGTSVVVLKGKEAFLRTSDIGTVYLRKSGSVAGPVALGVIGGILGAAGAITLFKGDIDHSPALGLTLLASGSAGGATAGALFGREAAKETVTIQVVPSIR